MNSIAAKNSNLIDDSFCIEEFAFPFLAGLNLSYTAVQEIRKKAEQSKTGFSPRSALAALAYIYLKKDPSTKMSLRSISRHLGVSQMSIFRYLKQHDL